MRLAILGVLASCAGHAPPAETLRVAGDLAARVDADGAVSVVARVDYAGVVGWGDVRFLHASLEGALVDRQVRVARAGVAGARGDAARAPGAGLRGGWHGWETIQGRVYSDVAARRHLVRLAFTDPAQRERAVDDMIEILRGSIRSCVHRWQDDLR